MFASLEEAVSNTRLNLLVPFGEQMNEQPVSTWQLFCQIVLERPRDRLLLGPSRLPCWYDHQPSSLWLRRFGSIPQSYENGQGAVLICEAHDPTMKWDIALHGREIAAQRAPE